MGRAIAIILISAVLAGCGSDGQDGADRDESIEVPGTNARPTGTTTTIYTRTTATEPPATTEPPTTTTTLDFAGLLAFCALESNAGSDGCEAINSIREMQAENARLEADNDAARAQRRQESMERSRLERGESGDVYYENCDAARSAFDVPLYYGEQGYRAGLDSDGDGVACEVG